MTTADILAAALGASQYPSAGPPSWMGISPVIANVYPGGFDRLRGCLGAAVYAVPARRIPRAPALPPALRLVACWRFPGETRVTWTTACLGDAP